MAVNKTHTAMLFLYGTIALLSILGILANFDQMHRTPIIIWAMIAGTSACGAMIELILFIRTRSALRKMQEQIQQMSKTGEVGMVMLEDRWPGEDFTGILNQYLTLINKRIDHLSQQRKELDLLISAGDSEKNNTEAIVSSISDGVIVANAFNELTLANKLAEDIFGFKLEEDKNKPINKLIDNPRICDLFDPSHWESAGPVRFEEKLLVNGKERVFDITFTPVRIHGGDELWAISMIMHDVTRERELAELKNDFVNHVSHELRTPLSSIKAYTELLLDDEIKSESSKKEFYRIIENETNRLDRFIENILNLSRIESGMLSVRNREVNLHDEIQQVLNIVRCLADAKSISIDYTPADKDLMVYSDSDLLRQAVLNLLSNGIKYTQEKGKIILSTGVDELQRNYLITVSDNGRGISPQDVEKIFDRFYRSRENSSVACGTGLGLTLVKKIVEDVYKGKIKVESAEGKGSQFTIILPIEPDGVRWEDQETLTA